MAIASTRFIGCNQKNGGLQPFKEVGRMGAIPLGEARETSSGKLPFKSIIHVAGINMLWLATEFSVKQSVLSAMEIVTKKNYASVALPLIGSGSGNRGQEWSLKIMQNTFKSINTNARVKIVIYKKSS